MKKSTIIFLAIATIAVLGRYIYMTPNVSGGELAPDFSGTLPSGENFTLSDLRGNYVLLDFWGSWCGPCRGENPKLVALYKKYNGQSFKQANSFEIVSVAIERNEKRWLPTIKKDGLVWPYHILDQAESLKFFDSKLAGLYGVANLPTKFLINKNGETIGVNQSVEEIDAILGADLQ